MPCKVLIIEFELMQREDFVLWTDRIIIQNGIRLIMSIVSEPRRGIARYRSQVYLDIELWKSKRNSRNR